MIFVCCTCSFTHIYIYVHSWTHFSCAFHSCKHYENMSICEPLCKWPFLSCIVTVIQFDHLCACSFLTSNDYSRNESNSKRLEAWGREDGGEEGEKRMVVGWAWVQSRWRIEVLLVERGKRRRVLSGQNAALRFDRWTSERRWHSHFLQYLLW